MSVSKRVRPWEGRDHGIDKQLSAGTGDSPDEGSAGQRFVNRRDLVVCQPVRERLEPGETDLYGPLVTEAPDQARMGAVAAPARFRELCDLAAGLHVEAPGPAIARPPDDPLSVVVLPHVHPAGYVRSTQGDCVMSVSHHDEAEAVSAKTQEAPLDRA